MSDRRVVGETKIRMVSGFLFVVPRRGSFVEWVASGVSLVEQEHVPSTGPSGKRVIIPYTGKNVRISFAAGDTRRNIGSGTGTAQQGAVGISVTGREMRFLSMIR